MRHLVRIFAPAFVIALALAAGTSLAQSVVDDPFAPPPGTTVEPPPAEREWAKRPGSFGIGPVQIYETGEALWVFLDVLFCEESRGYGLKHRAQFWVFIVEKDGVRGRHGTRHTPAVSLNWPVAHSNFTTFFWTNQRLYAYYRSSRRFYIWNKSRFEELSNEDARILATQTGSDRSENAHDAADRLLEASRAAGCPRVLNAMIGFDNYSHHFESRRLGVRLRLEASQENGQLQTLSAEGLDPKKPWKETLLDLSKGEPTVHEPIRETCR